MDRRDFLKLLAASGALAGTNSCIFGGDGGSSLPPPNPRVDFSPRAGDASLTPYLVMPRLDSYQPDDPEWNGWAGAAWTDVPHPPHGFWFFVPEQGESVDVVVPVINLGNTSTHHLIVEVWEGPYADTFTLAEGELRDRRGPFTLHPGIITGYRLTFTRRFSQGQSAAICYDPFHDPIHSISATGRTSPDRKSLGYCPGIIPPHYPGSY